ncbi:MAG: type I-C CRISPR-associated protein Cas7/Csd2 [Leptolinea sp.]|jgi:CRISPR-associated protein Csd2|nr:type I-C CRISPR-associated protein Cas7/Csd2 [Leptolinea sp.]
MSTLQNKIDFAAIIFVKNANPNGDPLNGNRPRVDYNGRGEISDVCIKRKIRNRLQENGFSIFVQSDNNRVDSYPSLKSRVEGELSKEEMKEEKKFSEAACKKWMDVRAFGQVFAYAGESKGAGVSIGIRGPVSIHPAFSVAPVLDRISSIQITKSVSGEGDGSKRASDTMGMKHRVDHGVYIFYGSINPQLASKTGFSDEDANAIKKALVTLFRDDASSARPEGSMEVFRVYWWKHNTNNGQYSSAKVHRTVESRIKLKEGIEEPQSIHDYVIPEKSEIDKDLPGLACEILEGE